MLAKDNASSKKTNVAILDYGMGNHRSVYNAFKKAGSNPIITNKFEEINNSDGLVLPGVGAFPEAMNNIINKGLDQIIRDLVLNKKKPLLGICLGMQLLADRSYEGGKNQGLSLIEGDVKKIPYKNNLRLPHIGWNNIIKKNICPLFKNIDDDASFYFVHSYYFATHDKYITLEVEYGNILTAAIRKENIFGVQFHPERSQSFGLKCIHNFIKFL